jgi:hypothetical protein
MAFPTDSPCRQAQHRDFSDECRESLRQESMLLNSRYRHAQRSSRLAPSGPIKDYAAS